MKNRNVKIGVAVLSVAIILGLALFILISRAPTQLENPKDIYMSAVSTAADIQDFVLHTTKTLEIAAGSNRFTESWDNSLSFANYGSDTMQFSALETMTVGKHKTEMETIYSDGMVYLTVNGANFSRKATAEDIKTKALPAVLMDYNLYNQITGIDTKEEYIITLTNASAIEKWANLDGATLQSATGTAYISHSGNLTKCEYLLQYAKEDVQCRLSVTTEFTAEKPVISLPEDNEIFKPIDHLEGPILFERTSGYLMQLDSIESDYEDTVYFEAFGDHRQKTVHFRSDNVAGWAANVHTKITLKNDSRLDQETVYDQTEKFEGGIYTLTMDNTSTQNAEINQEHMQTYCQNILVSTILLPQHIKNCNITIMENVMRIDYLATEEFAEQICANACQDLYQGASLLDKITQNHEIKSVTGYLELDTLTGLPISSGILCESMHTIDNIPYPLTFRANQSYTITN